MFQLISPQGLPTAASGVVGVTSVEDLARMLTSAAEAAVRAATVATEAMKSVP